MDGLDVWGIALAVFWIGLALDWRRRWPSEMCLELGESDGATTPSGEDTLVVVPARDEADVVEECLGSLLEQSADFRHLVYVDDRSADETGAKARRLAEDKNATVIDGIDPPQGWSGKLWALEHGWRQFRESEDADSISWILLTDADIRHPKNSIRALRRIADEEDRDFVSVMVRLRAESLWERLLIPPFVYFFQLLYPFRRVADSRSKVSAAAGGCVLVRREVFEKSGGLEAIRGEVIDDVNLAKSVARAGGKLWLGLCDSMVSVRCYDRLSEITSMVARTAFTQLRYSYTLLACCVLILLGFLVAPPVTLTLSIIRGAPYGSAGALLAWAIQTATLWPAVRHHRVPAVFAFTLPAASLLYLWMTWLSAWRHFTRRGVAWKGRPVG